MTYFLVTLTPLSSSLFFRDAILDSASFDSATKSDRQATGIDLNNKKQRIKEYSNTNQNSLTLGKKTEVSLTYLITFGSLK